MAPSYWRQLYQKLVKRRSCRVRVEATKSPPKGVETKEVRIVDHFLEPRAPTLDVEIEKHSIVGAQLVDGGAE